MKTKTSKDLTIINAAKTVQSITATPKVTKSEAIKAAVERARILHQEKQDAYEIKVQGFNNRLKDAALASLQKQFTSGEVPEPQIRVSGQWGDSLGTLEISFDLSAGFNALLKESKKLSDENPLRFRENDVEKAIKAKLDTSEERVSLILKDEENVRVIDALLASLK
jgi:hypothetical protein